MSGEGGHMETGYPQEQTQDWMRNRTADTFKGETKAREKEKKKWAVSENLYLQIGIVINTVQSEHELMIHF